MADTEPKPLSAGELADIDSRYTPFPSFREWPAEFSGESLWASARSRFEEISNAASVRDLERAQEIALRTAAFDTGAIEGLYPTSRGLTFSVATQAAAWEQKVESESAGDALAHFKAQLVAFELVLDQATEKFPKVTQTWIRRLHEEVTAAQETYTVYTPVGPQQQPLPKGQYKTNPNHVRTADGQIHAYAPVDQVQPEMQRLVEELDSELFRAAHPILQAAYAHYAFVVIHPFADGNGRVARALASAYTYRAASAPLLVLAHQRDRYFSMLARADAGEPGPFIEFTANAARDGLEMIIESMKTAAVVEPRQILDEFKDLYLAQGDLSHQELDRVIEHFVEVLIEIVVEQVNSLDLPDGVAIEVLPASGTTYMSPPQGFKPVGLHGRFIILQLAAAAPAAASEESIVDIYASNGNDPASTVLLRGQKANEDFVLGLSDIYPEVSSAARFRTENFIYRTLSLSLVLLLERARSSLGDSR